jgi:hypothetical protein
VAESLDVQIGKRLTNLPALREIGFSANRRLPTGLAHLADHTTASPLQAASHAYNDALENLSHTTLLAA